MSITAVFKCLQSKPAKRVLKKRVCIYIFTPVKKIFLNIALVIFLKFCAFAQQKEFEFKNLTQENGLPSNESYYIYRDSNNFLWIATDQGVVRYNGNKMEFFDLPDNVVFKIYEDSKGRIWFFSLTCKLAYFYKGTINIYKYNNSIAKAFKSLIITNAWVNSDDEIIINSATQNFAISNPGVITKSDYFSTNKNDPTVFEISRIKDRQYFARLINFNNHYLNTISIKIIKQNKQLLYKCQITPGAYNQYGCVTTDDRTFFFFYGKTLIKLNEDGSSVAKNFSSVITSLEPDKENIWVGFIKGGAVLLDSGLNNIYKTLNVKSVTSIRKDLEGGTWFSTLEQGVFYLKNSYIMHLTGDSLLTGPVFRLLKTGDSSLLFANSNGIYQLSGNKISTIVKQSYNKVTDLFIDNNKNLCISGSREYEPCSNGEYKKSNNASYNNIFFMTSVSELINLQQNRYLMNTYRGVLLFDMKSVTGTAKTPECLTMRYFDSTVLKPGILFFDSKKQLWMGSVNALYRFSSLNNLPVQFKPADTLFKKGVTYMQQLTNGVYAIGVRFGGIVLMNDTGIIANITESNGLLNNSVRYILPLKDQIWAATSKGISVINFQSYYPLKYSIINIGKNDGLYNVTIYQLMQHNGNILAATSNGIYEINNSAQFLNNTLKPIPFYINAINYYKGDTNNIEKITLPYNKNKVIISYSAVCFNLPEKVKYYYRFSNFDTIWHEIASTEFLMENLIAGNYNLEMKAAVNDEQRFSEIQKLQVIIEKPWWQNNWLRLAGFIFLLATIYFFYKRRIRSITLKEKQTAALNTRMVELEQMALRSQMNPHFIFNCLTSIQQLIVSGNKTEANEYLVKFARLIRKTLELSANSFITVEEETNYIKEYLALEQLRIPGQFEFSIHIDANINAQRTEIPGMMLQPIIENSIRHGIKHLENKKGQINISLKDQGRYILCSIIDNGVGRTKSDESKGNYFTENKSYGMEIVSRRLSAITYHNEKEGKLDVEDLFNKDGSPAGTKVTMQLPFKTK